MGNSSSSAQDANRRQQGSSQAPPPQAQGQQQGAQPYRQPAVYNPQDLYYQSYGSAQFYGQQPQFAPGAYQGGPPPAAHPGGYQQPPYDSAAFPNPYQPVATLMTSYQRTATVRNQVNLKKRTLELEKGANSSLYHLTFKFDATAPGRVCTFIMAKEDKDQAYKVDTAHRVPAPVVFNTGLNQTFSKDTFPAAAQHGLDFNLYSLKELLDYQGEASLVIRMEALTDEGRAAGRSLAEVPPGGELPGWVQTQTTFVRVSQEDSGELSLRVLRQRLFINGSSYDLLDIYGVPKEQTGGGEAAKPDDVGAGSQNGVENVDGDECVICMSAPRDTAPLPCRHMCMCHSCADSLRTQSNKCPICRNTIQELLHIKMKAKATT